MKRNAWSRSKIGTCATPIGSRRIEFGKFKYRKYNRNKSQLWILNKVYSEESRDALINFKIRDFLSNIVHVTEQVKNCQHHSI